MRKIPYFFFCLPIASTILCFLANWGLIEANKDPFVLPPKERNSLGEAVINALVTEQLLTPVEIAEILSNEEIISSIQREFELREGTSTLTVYYTTRETTGSQGFILREDEEIQFLGEVKDVADIVNVVNSFDSMSVAMSITNANEIPEDLKSRARDLIQTIDAVTLQQGLNRQVEAQPINCASVDSYLVVVNNRGEELMDYHYTALEIGSIQPEVIMAGVQHYETNNGVGIAQAGHGTASLRSYGEGVDLGMPTEITDTNLIERINQDFTELCES